MADGTETELDHGHVVIAAITSCTNTSNPSVMLGAGLLARNAVAKGLKSKPWVKTSLAPGSKVVTEYLAQAGLTDDLEALGFHLVGYGCTTCIGNSGPLPEEISAAIAAEDLAVCSVLSGNRNFEGRINPDVKMNIPRVAAARRRLRARGDDGHRPARRAARGHRRRRGGLPVRHLAVHAGRSPRPSRTRSAGRCSRAPTARCSRATSAGRGSRCRRATASRGTTSRPTCDRPPYFEDLPREPEPLSDIEGARVLALLGDSVTTDHISPAGAIKKGGPAALYLNEHGVEQRDFNSYGSRRGNHEVMMRGTFANIRLRNQLAPGTEGGVTRKLSGEGAGDEMSIYDAAMQYQAEGTPLVVLAGTEYGSGSSRDWAAKGTNLLGVKAVIAQSFERIHRSNLVGMGVVPLQFGEGDSVESLGLTGEEEFSIVGLDEGRAKEVTVRAGEKEFTARVRIDTPKEVEYFQHGGILQFVLRQLLDEG
jgi:aconitate hydratase